MKPEGFISDTDFDENIGFISDADFDANIGIAETPESTKLRDLVVPKEDNRALIDKFLEGKVSKGIQSVFPGAKLGESVGTSFAAGKQALSGDIKSAKQILETQVPVKEVAGDVAESVILPASLALAPGKTFVQSMLQGFGFGAAESIASQATEGKDIDLGEAGISGGITSGLYGIGYGVGKTLELLTKKGPEFLMNRALNQSTEEVKREVLNRAPKLSEQLLARGITGSDNKMLSQAYAGLKATEDMIQKEAGKYTKVGAEGMTRKVVTDVVSALREQGFSISADDVAKLSLGGKSPEQIVETVRKILAGKAKNPVIKKILNEALSTVQQVAQGREANAVKVETIAKTLDGKITSAKNVPGAEAIVRGLQKIKSDTLAKGKFISVDDALELKRDIYKVLGDNAFKVDAKLAASSEGLKAVAAALSEAIGDISPTMKKLTEEQQMWIRLSGAMEQNITRTSKGGRQIIGLGDTILAAGLDPSQAVAVAGTKKLLELPAVKTNLAVALDKLGKIPVIDKAGNIPRASVVQLIQGLFGSGVESGTDENAD